jgi:Protein of unknown function (DUF1579)
MSRTIRAFAGFVAGLGLCGLATLSNAQESPVPKPTPEHERLALDVGTWDATIKSWMQGPGSEPSVSKGVEIAKLMPGGLWVLSEFHGKFGEAAFHGQGQTGYDPVKKKYIGTWVDSMSPSIMMMEGDFDPQTNTLTMYSKGVDPAGKPYDAKMVDVHKGKDTRIFSMSMKSDETRGEYVKMMEISYVKRPDQGVKE